MIELQNLIWIEKYRPQTFDDLILENKSLIQNFLQSNSIPSFIFYSSKPGTGKTSTAKLIIQELKCDFIPLNSSEERGIDTIRDKISLFARSLSSNSNVKRCVFLDEADGLTRQAQDSLRNLMEEYSDNCFFIFTANDVNKIIEPIRSRCQLVNFEKPNRVDIVARLDEICKLENVEASVADLDFLVNQLYPDIRAMVKLLQEVKVDSKTIADLLKSKNLSYEKFWQEVNRRNVSYIYSTVYDGQFDCVGFNNWLFHKMFVEYDNFSMGSRDGSGILLKEIAWCLADNEKSWNLNCNREVIFISNILKIMEKI